MACPTDREAINFRFLVDVFTDRVTKHLDGVFFFKSYNVYIYIYIGIKQISYDLKHVHYMTILQ